MAGTAVDTLTDPAPIALAKADLARRTRGIPMSSLCLAEVRPPFLPRPRDL
jgi:aminobenzoyl-glutamate utilization protein B